MSKERLSHTLKVRKGALGILEDKFLLEVKLSSASQRQKSNDLCGWRKVRESKFRHSEVQEPGGDRTLLAMIKLWLSL